MSFPQFEISDFPAATDKALNALRSVYAIVADGSVVSRRDELVLAASNLTLYAYGLTRRQLIGAAHDAGQIHVETDAQFLDVAAKALLADSPTSGSMAGAIPWQAIAVYVLRLLAQSIL